MSDEWLERRQKMAKCKIHGLHYDPSLTSGCTLCRKEGLDQVPKQKPQFVMMLLAILGLTIVLYQIFEISRGGAADGVEIPTAEPVATVPTTTSLDPDDYRAAIEGIDQALFRAPTASLEAMGEQIVFTLRRLRRQLGEDPSSESREASTDVLGLITSLEDATFSHQLLQGARTGWTQLRRQHFGVTAWYIYPSAQDPRTDRAAITTYQTVADNLLSLLDEGTIEARRLAGLTRLNAAETEEERQQKREEWQAFRADWSQRISDLRGQLPARPGADADPQILVATQRLETAFSKVNSLASANDLPPFSRLDDALITTEQAVRSFNELTVR